MTCAPNVDSNQPANPCTLISLCCLHEGTLHQWLLKNLSSEDSDQTADAQADLNLYWAHVESTFSVVAALMFSWRNKKRIDLKASMGGFKLKYATF